MLERLAATKIAQEMAYNANAVAGQSQQHREDALFSNLLGEFGMPQQQQQQQLSGMPHSKQQAWGLSGPVSAEIVEQIESALKDGVLDI